ncbi:MAG: hypothetical protein K2X32_09545, partial [Phycisphaerales bacterium]|nr:hypothetical protein [Phycisphaerales bacterium]
KGMKLTRERKVYVAVLSAAGAIWGIDRVVLSGGPQNAHAGVVHQTVAPKVDRAAIVADDAATRSSARAPAPARAADRTAQPTLASRLKELSQRVAEGDRLNASSGLFEEPAWAKPAVIDKAKAVDPAATEAEFRDSHELTAVLTVAGKPMAIINGRLLQIGETLGGYRLAEIQRDAVLLERGQASVRLALGREGQPLNTEPAKSASAESAPGEAKGAEPRRQD